VTKDQQLWDSLKCMPIGPDDAELSFQQRLAGENSWSLDFSNRVLLEYKKFIFLIATSQGKTQLTPSDEVDQAWHLHLAYTRDYWDVMCQKILDFPLHHGPTSGGKIEREKYFSQYEATLALYRITFNSEPPADIWPQSHVRFTGRWRRINTRRNFVFPRAKTYAAALVPATAILAACASIGETPYDFIILGLMFLIALLVAMYFRSETQGNKNQHQDKKNSDSGGGCGIVGSSDDGSDSSGCGGCGGCGGD
jgi:hypothetical protein